MHEWGYRFNESGRIQDLTTTQHELIALAEQAEAYIREEQQQRNQPGTSKTGLENRESKRKRIQEAKRRYVD